jgi:NAD(P)-dependent dehydrogenase (short-subunit alcohol dehydrogenase family)
MKGKKKFRNYESYALVTGAASGMGRIYVRRLAQMGYNVVMVDINAKGLDETDSLVRDDIQDPRF